MTEAVNKAAKTAYISKILIERNKIERYDTALNLKNETINNSSYNRLNKIKKTDPEAFYYFMKSCEIP
ncbi:MAG: hypothetical protein FXF54_00420 [Kosmotoga sp.]|nr:MAG: hypothetical protein FXF54_00420 [Kosmotoga sp.]